MSMNVTVTVVIPKPDYVHVNPVDGAVANRKLWALVETLAKDVQAFEIDGVTVHVEQ